MSYSGQYISIENKSIEELIEELEDIKKANKDKKIWIGYRICMNECDQWDHGCTCSTYLLMMEKK